MSDIHQTTVFDLFVVGGGVNGCGIAGDAAAKGLSVALAELGEFAPRVPPGAAGLPYAGLSSAGLSSAGLRPVQRLDLAGIEVPVAGAPRMMPRTRVINARRRKDYWLVTVQSDEGRRTHLARAIVNATGACAEEFIRDIAIVRLNQRIRLVRGAHIITRRLHDAPQHGFIRGKDGRIFFAIPYEEEFTLIGAALDRRDPAPPVGRMSEPERGCLLDFAARTFKRPVRRGDVVWSHAGPRPLSSDGATSATAAAVDYALSLDAEGAPLLNIFGGQIAPYRRFAEAALHKLAPFFPAIGAGWPSPQPAPAEALACQS